MNFYRHITFITVTVLAISCFSVQSSAYLTGYSSLFNPITHNYKSINKSSKFPLTIVLDPGHGGKDGGCSHTQHNEKRITLEFAHTLSDILKHYDTQIDIRFTRTEDKFVSLEQRAQMANDLQADLFISIHTNSIQDTTIRGFEAFVYGKSGDAPSHIENLIQNEDTFSNQVSDISQLILTQLSKSATDERSLILGEKIHRKMAALSSIKNRGLKQAEFKVLKYTEMPSVLLELGFLTNPQDSKLLNSKNGQKELAEQITSGIIEYLEKV